MILDRLSKKMRIISFFCKKRARLKCDVSWAALGAIASILRYHKAIVARDKMMIRVIYYMLKAKSVATRRK